MVRDWWKTWGDVGDLVEECKTRVKLRLQLRESCCQKEWGWRQVLELSCRKDVSLRRHQEHRKELAVDAFANIPEHLVGELLNKILPMPRSDKIEILFSFLFPFLFLPLPFPFPLPSSFLWPRASYLDFVERSLTC